MSRPAVLERWSLLIKLAHRPVFNGACPSAATWGKKPKHWLQVALLADPAGPTRGFRSRNMDAAMATQAVLRGAL